MAPSTEQADAHQALIDKLDINSVRKPFRNPNWKVNLRRNKNIKTILGDAIRKEASLVATLQNSGNASPTPDKSNNTHDDDSLTSTQPPNLAQASKNLSKLGIAKIALSKGCSTALNLTYTGIESGPSITHPKHYCDITGLPAPYTDPKTRLRYHNMEVFRIIRSLGPGIAEQYLEVRGAHTILK